VKKILNNTRRSYDRYTLIDGHMGSSGCPAGHANHVFEIGCGIDRGNGYQGYCSIDYFMFSPDWPSGALEARENLKKILKELGYNLKTLVKVTA